MLNQYIENMDLICDLFKKIFNQKNTSKISFSMLNNMFDSDSDEIVISSKLDQIIKKEDKYILPSVLLLMLQDSFEYFVKYEDKYNNIKDTLFNNKSIIELAQTLKEDMWPFCPFFQEALTLFAKVSYPDIFKETENLELVFESSLRELVFFDSDGVIPITFDNFFNQAELFIKDALDVISSINIDSKISFHEISEISSRLNQEYEMFRYDFLEPYINLSTLLESIYNEVFGILSKLSIKMLSPEINATLKYTKDKISFLSFDIKASKSLDSLEKNNDLVNDLKIYAVTRFNEFSDFISQNNISEDIKSYNELDFILSDSKDGLDNLYDLIDEKIKVLEARYEYKKRLRLVKDLSIKIKNFYEFLIGLKTEIGDMSYITKRQIANFKSKENALFLLKRLQLQKNAYFKNVHVFDYLSMSIDIEDADFKIYKRQDFDNILSLIKTMEKFLIRVKDSLLPEQDLKSEADYELDGRKLDINGNMINVMLMNEDFSELDFSSGDSGHTFNIHDYNAYHNLVDCAVDVRKQPVFQDYGDISEYPYFKPFSYQVDSVRTMLQRFEGKGVFGDQVGLGKTLEALMCADVMFRCATIKNAVVVTTKQTIRQWRNEASTKFRHEDGSPMFEIYPKHGSYSFRELMKELVKDKTTKDSNALKLYLVSTEQIKSKDTLDFIKETGIYFGLKNAAYNPMPYTDIDTKIIDIDLKSITSFKHLETIKKRLPLELSKEIKDSLENNDKYKKITSFNVYGFFTYEFDSKTKIFVLTNPNLYDEAKKEESVVINEVALLKDYSKKYQEIDYRIKEIKQELDGMKDNFAYANKRLVDLLIFDEVQDLLYDFNDKDAKEALLQEFIANIQKKYCILISATPIKNDLSDIFNLLYMVDKNRLGDTKEKAEAKFYNAYCGGARSLAEMACAVDAKNKFKKLNGLINSMFTRKRLYDSDVIESIRRHSATKEEIAYAKSHNRDDYGGQAFMKLVGVIRRAKEALNSEDYPQFIEKYIRPLFLKYDIKDEIYKDAFIKIADCVDEASNICVKRLESELRINLGNFNVFEKLAENYRLILSREQEDDKDDVYYVSVKTCNLLTSYINRGLLAFYRSYQEYPTVFLSDYLDWVRPRKRGVNLLVNSLGDKVSIFKDLLVQNDYKFEKYDILPENLNALEAGKILFYEKDSKIRSEIYNNIKEYGIKNNNRRRVYMTLTQADEKYYDLSDFIHFCYFPKGNLSDKMKEFMETLDSKEALSFDEVRLKETYTKKGTLLKNDVEEDTYQGLNFKNFTEFSANNENWNSIYFIDKTMLAGTDFNAANILVIGQLDNSFGEYLDPLELEQLIGRISRMGQTEECICYTCLYNGNDKEESNLEFNKVYYDILTDEMGFDLYGVCQTEVDFVMPVILALAKRIFSPEYSFVKEIPQDKKSDFNALYIDSYIEYNVKRFPDLVKYVYDNNDKIKIYYDEKEYMPVDALKEMIRVYSNVLKPEKRG